jgi:hypothetical protein
VTVFGITVSSLVQQHNKPGEGREEDDEERKALSCLVVTKRLRSCRVWLASGSVTNDGFANETTTKLRVVRLSTNRGPSESTLLLPARESSTIFTVREERLL